MKAEGTESMESDSLIISRTGLLKTGNSSLKRSDGIGSSMQVVGLKAVIRQVKASGEIISNGERDQLVCVTVPASIKILASSKPLL